MKFITGKRNSWRQKREDQLSHKIFNEKLLTPDGEVVDVNQLKKYLHLEQKIQKPVQPVFSQNVKYIFLKKYLFSRLQDRISKKQFKFFHLDFMLPHQVLNQPDIENDDNLLHQQQQSRSKINSTTSLNSMDPLQRAKNLGLGSLCKSFREMQKEERKRKEAFQKDLQKLLKTQKKTKQASDQNPSIDTCSILRQRSIQIPEIKSQEGSTKSPEKYIILKQQKLKLEIQESYHKNKVKEHNQSIQKARHSKKNL